MTPEQQAAIREEVARGLARDRVLLNARHARCTLPEDFISRAVGHAWPDFVEQADAAIAAHLKALEAAGIVPVPIEPTEAMIEASNREWDGRMSHRSSGAWEAMIAARPR